MNFVLEWMGLNFQYYDGLQPKIRAGIINEHECNFSFQHFFNFMKSTIITLNFYHCQKSEINLIYEDGKQLWMKENEFMLKTYLKMDLMNEL